MRSKIVDSFRTFAIKKWVLLVLFPVLVLNGQWTPGSSFVSIAIKAPLNGSAVSGTVAISATAFANAGVASVQFLADGIPIGAQLTASPYTVNWNSQSVANGQHNLSAVALDAGGARATAAISVVVNNAPPPAVSITVGPPSVSLTASQTQQFTATVTGSSNTGVSWSLSGPGSVTNGGLYMAPATIGTVQNVVLIATSLADGTKTATALIGLTVPAPSVSITLGPPSVSLTASQTQQFTATVSGSSNTGVSWSLNGPGSVTNGLYTAPASISSAQNVVLTATSLADASKTATAMIGLAAPPPPVSITLGPPSVNLTASQTQQFTATVTGSSNTGVSWSLNGPGSVTNGGLYTAPATIASAQNVVLTATSLADGTKTATALIGLTVPLPSVSITLGPPSVSLTASQTQQFTATVTGSSNTGVSWSLSGPGSVTNGGLYTAPATIASAQNVTLTATSLADGTKTATALIGLTVPPPSVSITLGPPSVNLAASQTQQFTATVTGSSNTGVSWSLNGPGSVSNGGMYTAPATIATAQNVTLTATSLADSTKTATGMIGLTVQPASVSIMLSPQSISMAASQTQQFTATVTGSSNTGVSWSLAGPGSVSNAGLYTAPATITSSQNVVLIATSLADGTKTATALIGLTVVSPSVSITLSPPSVSLTASQTQQFTATVTGSSNSGVSWSISGPGSVSNAGLYTAPPTISNAQSVTLTATSLADATKLATAIIALTLTPGTTPLGISISAPANGSTVSGSVVISATASGAGVAGVQFLADGVNIGAEVTAPPFTVNWNSQSVSNATHNLSAVARDTSGNKVTAAISVTVSNTTPGTLIQSFQLTELFGVSHASQVVELAYGTKVNLSQTYMLGPGGTEVAFQQLSNGNILVQTDLPANSTKVFQLMSGRAPTAASPVSVTTKSDSFEISNGLTGVRVARPQEAGIPSLAPVQGIQLKDSTWTAVGPNYLYVPGDGPYAKMVQLIPLTVSTQIVEQGPLQATIVVSYTFDRPPLYQTVLLIPGGSGHYTSTIKLQAGQSAIVMEDETDMDLQYYLNTQAPVQPTQLRYRGHVATQLQFGWQSNGQIYGLIGARANSDATRDLPQNLPVYSSYLTADYSSNGGYQLLKRVSQWDIWGPDGGWYWLMYNAQAAAAAPVLGIFAGQASRAVGTNASGPGLYSLPDNGQGIRASGINLRINRRGPDGSLATTVRLQWGIFVGTKGADLADPNQLQTIQQPLNLYGGINLSKVLGYQTSYPDPPGGWSSMYLSRAQTQALIQRVRTDDTFYSNMYHADGTMKPILDAWRDTSGTLAKALVNQITTSAQTILNVLINGNGIYDFNYGYIMGGELMSQWEATASALLAAGQLAPADQAQLKAVLALFGNILWDDDFAPMQNGSGINLGTQNMPVQSISYRYQYTLLLAQAQYPGMLGARLQAAQTDPMQTLQDQVNDWGAQHGSPHYAQASMDPLLDSLQQIKVAGQGDAFQSQPKLAKFADFYLNFQTPPEVRFGGVRKMVSLGDGATESNSMFGQLATGFADSNPGLSQRLMQAWMEGGSSQSGYAGNAALKVDQTLSAAPQQLTSGTYPGYYSVLRSGVGSGQENAAWVINGNWYDDHNHDDQGSLALYALGAPLSIDWGDGQVAPRTIGGYFHNLVLPASAIGAPWDQDSLLVSTVDSPWSNPQQVAFESFGASSRSVSSFTAADGTTWTRTLRMLSGNAAAPVILIEDNFGGAGANLPKVWSMNMMSNAAVQTPQGTVIPPLRMWSSLAGGPQQLPSARPAQSLAAGLNRFQFTGQWKIDWDLYTYSSQTQQALIGNWSHDWHPDVERLQFLTANGRTFLESQDIFRLNSSSGFQVMLLPHLKGQSSASTLARNSSGQFVTNAPDPQTIIDNNTYAYNDGQRIVVTGFGSGTVNAFGVQISGGSTEVILSQGHVTITAHGAPGQRQITLPVSVSPVSPVQLQGGTYILNYTGPAPLQVTM